MMFKCNPKLLDIVFWYPNSAICVFMGMLAYPYTHFWGLTCITLGLFCLCMPYLRRMIQQRKFVKKMKKDGFM